MRIDGRTRAGSRCGSRDLRPVEVLAIPARNDRPDMGADLLQRGVSDHLRGRGLGRPSGHFGWSLTPRDCSWRPLRQWRGQAGGTERRPRTTGCNLLDILQLPEALRRARVALVAQDKSSMRANPRGTPRAEGCSPRCSPGTPCGSGDRPIRSETYGRGSPVLSSRTVISQPARPRRGRKSVSIVRRWASAACAAAPTQRSFLP